MINKKTLFITALSLCIAYLVILAPEDARSQNLIRQNANDFKVTYQSISSILRTDLLSVFAINDAIYVGDNVGSVSIWSFDEKKNKLNYEDISRQAAAVLPDINKVIDLDGTSQAILVLTQDGKVTAYLTNSALKITGKVPLQISESLKQIKVISYPEQKLLISGITTDGNKLCIYQVKQSIARPNPLQTIICNSTTGGFKYSGLDYYSNNSLISVGDSSRAILFSLNLTESNKLQYLCEAFLPKTEGHNFKSEFSKNGTLLAINNLWLNSIIIDLSVPSAKVLSSERTQKLVKTGETSALSVNHDTGKNTKVIINTKGKIQGYALVNQKLSYQNDSRILGKSQHFILKTTDIMLATQTNKLIALKVGNIQQAKDYLTVLDSYPISSHNHFKSVIGLAYWNGTLVTTSDSGQNNFKVWHYSDNKLTFIDQKTFAFFSVFKSGPVSLPSIAMMPPPQKSSADNAANATLHIALAGNEPFNIIIVKMTNQGKIGTNTKSKGEHFNNITALFLTPDQQTIVTASMDSLIKVWKVSANREQIEQNETTIQTKYGPINTGVQDKTGTYFVVAHCSTLTDKLANITIWKLDPKHGVVKVGQNVPGEAHQSNLTSLLLSHDEKYLISLSESGQLRLWQHKQWTIVDLLASLSLGFFNGKITMTQSNRVIVQSNTQFIEYAFDFNGFILMGRSSKQFNTPATILKAISEQVLLEGAQDGSIRVYNYSD